MFIDGCFWHSCPVHGTTARTNAEYWATKLAQNMERDEETNSMLAEAGWLVLREWEHEPADASAKRIIQAVRDVVGHR